MKYLKTLALLITLSILTSCSEGFEDFPADTYSANEVADTKSTEPTDSTGGGNITIIIDDPDVEDIDYVITLP